MDARWTPARLNRLPLVGAGVACLFLMAVMLITPAAAVAGGKLLVYSGNNAVNEGYTQFAAAAGRTPSTSSTLPVDNADFDQYQCIVLPVIRTAFTATQRTALLNYVSRGGTLLALTEHLQAPGGVGTAATAVLNALASGTGIQALNTTATDAPWTTTNVVPLPLHGGRGEGRVRGDDDADRERAGRAAGAHRADDALRSASCAVSRGERHRGRQVRLLR